MNDLPAPPLPEKKRQEERRCPVCRELVEAGQPKVDDMHLACSVKLADGDDIDRDHGDN